jgi:hypothetical protein
MYMPVHFGWKIETLQAYISIQYYAQSAPFCQIHVKVTRYYLRTQASTVMVCHHVGGGGAGPDPGILDSGGSKSHTH